MKQPRVCYYRGPIHDDFAGTNINTRVVDDTYPYERGAVWRVASWVLYYLIAYPIVYLICKLFGFDFSAVKGARRLIKGGFCLYGNHTHFTDAFLPPIVAFPKRAYTVAGADAVSIGLFSGVPPLLGAVPIPTGLKGMSTFLGLIKKLCTAGCCIGIFPEAHIWPYYTGIRPLQPISFRYPVAWNVPAVAMVVTYHRHGGLLRFIKTPARKLHISEPMYPREDLSPREAQRELCQRVQDYMERTVKQYSTYEYISYQRVGEE